METTSAGAIAQRDDATSAWLMRVKVNKRRVGCERPRLGREPVQPNSYGVVGRRVKGQLLKAGAGNG